MKYYKVIARNFDDLIIQESIPHTWEECQELYHEYFDYDEVCTVEIKYIGNYPNVPEEEDRCRICGKRTSCPAYKTGVIYPCPHFREEEANGKE